MSALGPAVAGSWYPADPTELSRLVDKLLDEATPRATADPPARALVAPHAGFAWSGRVAASGFAALRGATCTRVVLIGPSHHVPFSGIAAPRATRYRTPLGEIPIDGEALASLASPLFRDDEPFRLEHSLEAELPFLQRALGTEFALVPLLCSGLDAPGPRDLAVRALLPLLGPGVLLVASSDFTHYGPRFSYLPFTADVERRIGSLDGEAIDLLLRRDVAGFDEFLRRTRATICGRDGLRLLIALLPPGARGRLAAYDTSGRIAGSFEHSVSYASLVFDAGNGA